MRIITAIYEAKDEKIFNSPTAEYECRQHEIDLDLAPVRHRLKKCGLTEIDIDDNYNATYKRRHGGTLISARIETRKDYIDFCDYVYRKYGEPKEVKEKEILNPDLPMQLDAVVHRGVKRSHCEFYPRQLANSFTHAAEPDMDAPPVETKAWSKAKVKKYNYNGEEHTLREIASMVNIAYSTLIGRLNRGMDFEKAISMPRHHEGRNGATAKTNLPTLPA